ncbi:MAG: NAD-dependent DNA ligase LigA [Candidatus Amulumruptor caecigallinarius]|nr:NAD-dependent DNA ligase LigA [Candidatus Amulumruptor caecigallinarius]MCM1397324.1 NAD-dependent DNA ligase LigA [Candidatus Amulumruptor caecigallinarius]MCM1453612.1 NAD-dependent DNA ligase LigA [bacterium]
MTPEEAKARIDSLRNDINDLNHRYYVLNDPAVSDFEFDKMLKELETLEAKFPQFHDPMSPTQRVGSDLTKGFEQVAHLYPMLSLSNTYSVGEVDDFVNRARKDLMGEEVTIVGEMKFDGTSISLIYKHGELVRAVTRGDGEKGDVVTANVRTIRSIPLRLRGNGWPDRFELRGEILLPWKAFDRLNAEREFNEEPLFANPRNAASGTLKLQDPTEVARRGLDAYFYYLLADELPSDNHYDNMMAVKSWGFKVSDIMRPLHSISEVDQFISHWDTARKELPVATDGLVFKVNSLRQQLNLGLRAKSPRWAIAYKFQAERALTQLRFVSFEVGRMGIVTPVANLEPVLLSGTVVKRASLHNADIVSSLGIHEHDMLYVEKGGEIIPKITGVDTSARQPDARPVTFVTHCPSCGTRLVREEGEAAWVCPNRWGCPPQIEGRIEHFAGRRMMDIDGIGEETVTMLYDAGLVKVPADLYDLSPADLLRLDRMGERSAERLLDGIKASLAVPFERVVYALSIPYVGETVARKIARAVGSMDRLMAMTATELVAIDDVGPRIAASIIDYFDQPANRDNVERLRRAGVRMEAELPEGGSTSDILAGKSIVISGTFTHHSRDEYKEMIERNGGKNIGSVSKKTSFILAGDNIGPAKLEKANSLGIPLVSEDEFLRMLDAQASDTTPLSTTSSADATPKDSSPGESVQLSLFD